MVLELSQPQQETFPSSSPFLHIKTSNAVELELKLGHFKHESSIIIGADLISRKFLCIIHRVDLQVAIISVLDTVFIVETSILVT